MHNFSLEHIKWSPSLYTKEHCDGEPVGSPCIQASTVLPTGRKFGRIISRGRGKCDWTTMNNTIHVDFSPAYGLDFV